MKPPLPTDPVSGTQTKTQKSVLMSTHKGKTREFPYGSLVNQQAKSRTQQESMRSSAKTYSEDREP